MKALAILRQRDGALALIVVGLIAAIGARAPVFVTPQSLVGVLTDTSFLFMLALAPMAVILTRGIEVRIAREEAHARVGQHRLVVGPLAEHQVAHGLLLHGDPSVPDPPTPDASFA